MKKVRLCLEVQGLAVDDCGTPAPAGIQIELGEVTDEHYADVNYFESWKALDLQALLDTVGLSKLGVCASAVKIISPDEYDREYADIKEAPHEATATV